LKHIRYTYHTLLENFGSKNFNSNPAHHHGGELNEKEHALHPGAVSFNGMNRSRQGTKRGSKIRSLEQFSSRIA
jgi:hypothetical protein